MVKKIRAMFQHDEGVDLSQAGGAAAKVSAESKILPMPKNATKTVYVEGIPTDATEREVAHIFRPFIGFKTVRLIPREKRPGEKVILCFADFESTLQTTIVINTLQGYRFDRDDILGLQFSYAITNNKSQGSQQAPSHQPVYSRGNSGANPGPSSSSQRAESGANLALSKPSCIFPYSSSDHNA